MASSQLCCQYWLIIQNFQISSAKLPQPFIIRYRCSVLLDFYHLFSLTALRLRIITKRIFQKFTIWIEHFALFEGQYSWYTFREKENYIEQLLKERDLERYLNLSSSDVDPHYCVLRNLYLGSALSITWIRIQGGKNRLKVSKKIHTKLTTKCKFCFIVFWVVDLVK